MKESSTILAANLLGPEMKRENIHLPEIKIVGIACRTDNASEMSPDNAKIGAIVAKYMQEGTASKVQNALNPYITYSIYTDYESDHTGKYTYVIGTQVSSFDGQPEDLTCITIPAQNYVRFTNGPGSMPIVCIEAWQRIWQMNSEDFNGDRAYKADFEVYDERAFDPQNTILDILVGIE